MLYTHVRVLDSDNGISTSGIFFFQELLPSYIYFTFENKFVSALCWINSVIVTLIVNDLKTSLAFLYFSCYLLADIFTVSDILYL